MNFECGICSELLYRGQNVSHTPVLQTLIRHNRLNEVNQILNVLGYEDDDSRQHFKKVLRRFRQLLCFRQLLEIEPTVHQPIWAKHIMIQYFKTVATPCGHLFHCWCLKEWFQFRKHLGLPMCPYCRQFCSSSKICVVKFGPIIKTSSSEKFNSNKVTCRPFQSDDTYFTSRAKNGHDKVGEGSYQGIKNILINFFERQRSIGGQNTKAVQDQILKSRRYKCYAKNLKISCKIEIILPILSFLFFVWRIHSYVNQKKEVYEMDEENLLNEQYFMDGYVAFLIFSACWICLMLDCTLLSCVN